MNHGTVVAVTLSQPGRSLTKKRERSRVGVSKHRVPIEEEHAQVETIAQALRGILHPAASERILTITVSKEGQIVGAGISSQTEIPIRLL